MTDPYRLPEEPSWQPQRVEVGRPVAAAEEPPRSAHAITLADVRVAAVLTVVLAVVGALLGLVWSVWSGPQQRAYVLGPGRLEPFDEVETMAAADGRYLLLVGVTGLLAALLAWWLRAGNRGALVVLGLGAGGLAGAALTWWVGYLAGGGTYDGATGTVIEHLPLTLHMHGLVFVEAALATLVYGLFVAFAARDDLSRADPVQRRASVGARRKSQRGRGHGDAAGSLQESDLPTQ
jgi:hypothetical protein